MTISSAPSRLPRKLLSTAVLALACAAPSMAFAQTAPTNPNCPPGSWFCADTQEKPAAPAGQPVAPADEATAPKGDGKLAPLPGPNERKPPQVTYAPAPPPPVVIYQPPPPVIVREAPPPYYYAPRPAPSRREWGLNLHLEGAMLGSRANNDASMGGAGFGLRYKPIPHFGLEADVDFVGGRDYNGDRRGETAFTLNALFFVNPKSKTQLYFLAGFGWAGANVTHENVNGSEEDLTYKYFGGQIGAGLEFRLARHFALNLDVRGFIRGRTDDNVNYRPEFVSADGRTTNTSGGGLITGGMTFYF